MNNINSLVDQLRLNNKNLTEEIQLISNTTKLHSKFQFEIYTIMAKNKINFKLRKFPFNFYLNPSPIYTKFRLKENQVNVEVFYTLDDFYLGLYFT